jgi:hypothetical protein
MGFHAVQMGVGTSFHIIEWMRKVWRDLYAEDGWDSKWVFNAPLKIYNYNHPAGLLITPHSQTLG